MHCEIYLLCLLLVQASGYKGLQGKTLLFPEATSNSYVTLTTLKPLSLSAFTLCMRLAVNTNTVYGDRETILFAYRLPNTDELNVWQEGNSINLYLSSSSNAASFPLATPLSIFSTSMCVSWESSTGLTSLWLDGRRLVRQVYRKGYNVVSAGTVILGQDPDTYLGKFSQDQSYVGEISDVHMWDFVLNGSEISTYTQKTYETQNGNVLNWNSVEYQTYGNVFVLEDKSEILKI